MRARRRSLRPRVPSQRGAAAEAAAGTTGTTKVAAVPAVPREEVASTEAAPRRRLEACLGLPVRDPGAARRGCRDGHRAAGHGQRQPAGHWLADHQADGQHRAGQHRAGQHRAACRQTCQHRTCRHQAARQPCPGPVRHAGPVTAFRAAPRTRLGAGPWPQARPDQNQLAQNPPARYQPDQNQPAQNYAARHRAGSPVYGPLGWPEADAHPTTNHPPGFHPSPR
jgi:hypothetical protein